MQNKSHLFTTVAISMLLHVAILVALHQKSVKESRPVTKTIKPKTIKTQLIFTLPIKEVTPEKPPEKEIKTEPTKVQTPNKKAILPPITQPIVPPKETPKPVPVPAVTQPSTVKTAKEVQPLPVKDSLSTHPTQTNSQFTGTAGKHVQSINQQLDRQAAQNAGRYFQQQKQGGVIHAPNKNRFVSEEEKFIQKNAVRANCDGAARKATAILLGFMGSNINCSGKPNINSFINKHVNKEQHLDAKYQKPLNKRPQSVVIQN